MISIKTVKFVTKEVKKEFSSKKHYTIINLIIASRAKHYDIFTYCWLQYMNKNPDVKSFFLYSDPTIENDLLIDTNSITYKCEESLIPGILFKTLAAEKFCQKYMSYDYILRTNLSSFIHFPRLLTYLTTHPKEDFMCTNLEYFPLALNEEEIDKTDKCIAGVIEYNKDNWKAHTAVLRDFFGFKTFFQNNQNFYFLAGSFFIMSKDVIDKLLYEVFTNNVLERAGLYKIPDDLVISAIAQLESIQPFNFITTTRYSKQCKELEDPTTYADWIFHIRNRTDTTYGHREVDVMNMVEQVRHFYNLPDFLNT
jgi:hypothetical protein